MLASTSSVLGETRFDDPLFFFKRQLAWLAVGTVAAVVASAFDYHHWRKLAIPLALSSIALLVMALVPGVGMEVKGARRWVQVGGMSVQSSEVAKFATIVLLAWWMSHVQHRATQLKWGMLVPLFGLCVILGLIFVEPDYGTTFLVALVGILILFAGGARLEYILVTGVLGLSAFTIAVMQNPERMRRVIAFANPERFAKDEGFQLLNAIYAFVVGGGAGVGLGQSLQKHFYLPEAHTDFIFAIIGEELGLAGSMGVVLLYVLLFIVGIRISFQAPEKFGKLLGFGITLMITVQAAINIGVVTGSLPTKGLPLPFISFGGSSMVMSLVMIGVLINIARHADASRDPARHSIKDRAHRL